jgi:hypothetical protein
MWKLRIGTRLTGFMVRPDAQWTSMWRIHAPSGLVSDMVNLSRARDAAITWARPRGLGGNEVVHWEWDSRETAAG